MTTVYDVVLVDIMDEVVNNMVVPNYPYINYEPGTEIQILKSLNDLDNSITLKGKKYPIVAMVMPVRENRNTEFYAAVRIPRIVFGMINGKPNQSVLERYKEGGTFKSVLYPMYYEFLKQCARHPRIIGMDPSHFSHTKFDNPGSREVGVGTSDFLDSIEILDLELYLNQLKTC